MRGHWSGERNVEDRYRTLNDRAYEQIKKGLISGAFRSGQTLVIRTLAGTYGISTTPVREALQRLVAERHLELLPNRSIVVPLISADRFIELFRIRRELEGLAGELATPHFRSAHVARLQRLIEAMDKTLARGRRRLSGAEPEVSLHDL